MGSFRGGDQHPDQVCISSLSEIPYVDFALVLLCFELNWGEGLARSGDLELTEFFDPALSRFDLDLVLLLPLPKGVRKLDPLLRDDLL